MPDSSDRPLAVPMLHVAARHLAAGRPDDAREVLAALVAEAPAYAAAHVLHARAQESAGDAAGALAAWQRAAFLVPASPLVAREYARLARSAPRESDVPPQVSLPDLEASSPDSTGTPERHAPAENEAPEHEAPAQYSAEQARAEYTPAERAGLETNEPTVAPPPPHGVPEAPASADEPSSTGASDASVFSARSDEGWPVLSASEHSPPDLLSTNTATHDAGPEHVPEHAEQESAPERTEAEHAEAEHAEAEHAEAEPTSEHSRERASAVPAMAGSFAVADELESLIESLSNAPRIRPDPAFEGPEVSFADADADEVLSETLARIYAAQQQYARAAHIYEKLASQRPAQADDLLAKAAEMRQRG